MNRTQCFSHEKNLSLRKPVYVLREVLFDVLQLVKKDEDMDALKYEELFAKDLLGPALIVNEFENNFRDLPVRFFSKISVDEMEYLLDELESFLTYLVHDFHSLSEESPLKDPYVFICKEGCAAVSKLHFNSSIRGHFVFLAGYFDDLLSELLQM